GLARLNPDGSTDDGFDLSAQLRGDVFCMAAEDDASVLIGGAFALSDGTIAHALRVLAGRTLDPQFRVQADTAGQVKAMLVASDGSIFVGGAFQQINGMPRRNLARLNRDGSLHPLQTTGIGPDGPIHALAQDTKGGIWLGGHFTQFGGQSHAGFARLLPSGEIDLGFQPTTALTGFVNAIAVRPDGRVMLGGRFTGFQDASALALYQFDA